MKAVLIMLCVSCIPMCAQSPSSQFAFAPSRDTVSYYQLSHHLSRHVRKLVIEAIRDIQKKDIKRAEPLLQSALALDPGCWEAHINLGAVYFWRGEQAMARSQFEAAAALDPGTALGLADLAVCDLNIGLLDTAASLAKQALRLDPRSDLAQRVLRMEQKERKSSGDSASQVALDRVAH